MLASKNEYLSEASKTMFRMSADDIVRKRCRDREEYYQDLRNYERVIAESERKREQDLRNYERVIAESERKREQNLRDYKLAISQRDEVLREQSAQIDQLRAELELLKKK